MNQDPDLINPGVPGRIVSGMAWQLSHIPDANVIATVTQVAPGPNRRNIVTSITATLLSAIASVVQASEVVQVRSGDATILWTGRMHVDAGGDSDNLDPPATLIGGVNEPVTMEFLSAPGLQNFETVSMNGYVVEEMKGYL